MIRNRNGSLKHLDDLMLHRWENEGGCLGPLAMTDGDRHSDSYSRAVSDAELKLVPSAIDRAMTDHAFVEQLNRRSYRADRDLDGQTRLVWQERTTRGRSPVLFAGTDTAC